MARTGRRPGDAAATREAILRAAGAAFAARGYEGTTIRGVAAAAGVDPALVHHYFGTKSQLFAAALALPASPDRVLARALAAPLEDLGPHFVATVLGVWEAVDRNPVIALLRSAATNEEAAAMMRGFVEQEIVGRIAARLDGEDAVLRASLVASHVIGLALARYVVKVEPLASADVEDVVRWMGPAVQTYLTGELPPA